MSNDILEYAPAGAPRVPAPRPRRRYLRVRRALPHLAAFTAALVLPFMVSTGNLHLAVSVLIAAIGAVGLDVLTGRTGQVSLGHAFFLGVGALVGAKLGSDYGMDLLIWIPVAGVVTGLLGGLVGPIALRLRGLYLALVTMALVFIGINIFNNWTWLSGGSVGRAISAPRLGSLDFATSKTIGGLSFSPDGLFYYLALFILALTMLFVANLAGGRSGREMAAVRERELAAAVLGVDVTRTKITAFIVSSALAGVSGALYGAFHGYTTPAQDYGFPVSINYVVMVVVGGLATTYGPLFGALFVIGLPVLFQHNAAWLPLIQDSAGVGGGLSAGNAATFIFGLTLIVFLLFEPHGVVGVGTRLTAVLRRRSTPTGKGISQ